MKRHFFNPRLREGGDNFSYDYVFLRNFSIHASAKEATFHPRLNLHYLTTFQSTPPRRRRLPYASKLSETLFFQSTPPRRRRPENAVDEEEARNFQSTPPRRRRLDFSDNGVPNYGVFNPRLREGGDRSTAIYI